ncbi:MULTISPECIES: hypothetical protein [Rhizobium]|uniref:hypothetical protein n=1 Tax=Rhizobium TaxID=379 RepID=UPI0021809E35|nr:MULTISPECIES: hypothetical protein [Rhizobium]MDK4733197.1 hypothetical protein [Rhizobium sp. CNPSo 3490]MDO3432487.1 hypothetical protein [Rhizobium sp. CBN3]
MSSTSDKPYLTSSDLDMLQGVLDAAGYTTKIPVEDEQACNAAAMLLIKLFQEGVTSPVMLLRALEYHFGKPKKQPKPVTPVCNRYAIQGLPRERRTKPPVKFCRRVTRGQQLSIPVQREIHPWQKDS